MYRTADNQQLLYKLREPLYRCVKGENPIQTPAYIDTMEVTTGYITHIKIRYEKSVCMRGIASLVPLGAGGT